MSKKQTIKKSKKTDMELAPEEIQELEMILDRLRVQDPAGESLTNYLKSLSKALVRRETLAVTLIERLSKTPSEVGFRTFLALRNLLEGTPYRRVVKQAAYRFSQHGYSADSKPREEQAVVLIPKEAKKSIAHLIPVKGATRFLVALVYNEDAVAPVAVSALLQSHPQEIEVSLAESSQRLYRDFIRSMENEFSTKAYPVPVEHAARLFFEMIHLFGNRAWDQETDQVRHILQPFYKPEKPPYAYEVMPALDEPERLLSEVNEEKLLNETNFFAFILPKESLLPYWEKIKSVSESVLVVSPEVQKERVDKVLKDAVDELCVGATRSFYQRQFEEEALMFKLAKGDDELAMSAWITAQHLRTASGAGDNPVVLQIVSEFLSYYWRDEIGGSEKPVPEEQAPPDDHFYRTESGLLLPR